MLAFSNIVLGLRHYAEIINDRMSLTELALDRNLNLKALSDFANESR